MHKRTSMFIAILFLLAPLSFAALRAADASLTGKWITDTVIIAAQQRKARDEARRNAQPAIDPFAGGGIRGPRGGVRGAGARARGGNNFVQAAAAAQQEPRKDSEPAEKDEGPEMPAITMDLKVDKAKVTGTVIVISPEDLSDEKMKVEAGEVTGKKFKFTAYRKVGDLQVAIIWQGELVADNSIKLTRKTLAGKSIDEIGDVLFTRTK